MAASVVEQVLARVAAALSGATAAGTRVYRGLVDPVAQTDLPAINVRRATSSNEVHASNCTRVLVEFDIDHTVAEGSNWETDVDALHMQVHSALLADAPLALLGRGLRCTSTDPAGDGADHVIGRLSARYQMQVISRPGDLTKAIN